MKSMFGFFVFLLFLAGIAFVMLQGRQMAQKNLPAGGAELVGVKWRPDYIGANSVANDAELFIQFGIDGSINGHGGCNKFFGSLEKSDSGIVMGPLGATRMACPEPIMKLETEFMSALQSTEKFQLSGEKLILVDADDKLLVELRGEE